METIEKNGIEFVLVPRAAWDKLARGEVPMPELPPADAEGNRDALAYARVSIARTIIRDRVAAGLSQSQLAERAGITRQVLNRIEHARVTPDEATVGKIDKAIRAVNNPPRRWIPPERSRSAAQKTIALPTSSRRAGKVGGARSSARHTKAG